MLRVDDFPHQVNQKTGRRDLKDPRTDRFYFFFVHNFQPIRCRLPLPLYPAHSNDSRRTIANFQGVARNREPAPISASAKKAAMTPRTARRSASRWATRVCPR